MNAPEDEVAITLTVYMPGFEGFKATVIGCQGLSAEIRAGDPLVCAAICQELVGQLLEAIKEGKVPWHGE